jgi:hypothetical protein
MGQFIALIFNQKTTRELFKFLCMLLKLNTLSERDNHKVDRGFFSMYTLVSFL